MNGAEWHEVLKQLASVEQDMAKRGLGYSVTVVDAEDNRYSANLVKVPK